MCWPSIRAPHPRARSWFRGDISIRPRTAQQEFPQHFPASGLVEQEPEDHLDSTIATCREALKKAGICARGRRRPSAITNQRETTVVWTAGHGNAVHRASSGQDRRNPPISAARLKAEGHEPRDIRENRP